MLFSYRKTIDSDYPDMRSEEAKKSFEMLKKIKEELSTGKLNQHYCYIIK